MKLGILMARRRVVCLLLPQIRYINLFLFYCYFIDGSFEGGMFFVVADRIFVSMCLSVYLSVCRVFGLFFFCRLSCFWSVCLYIVFLVPACNSCSDGVGVCVCTCVRVCLFVCACVCQDTHARAFFTRALIPPAKHTCMRAYMHTHSQREREREREGYTQTHLHSCIRR